MTFFRMALLLLAAALLQSNMSLAQTVGGKRALILGVGAYDNIRPLDNPAQDAALADEMFRNLGFQTLVALDTDADAMRLALQAFRLDSAGADVAVIYFAGHGMQIDGANYLLPRDASGTSLGTALQTAIPVEELTQAFGLGAQAKILMLDACRDNPFDAATRSLLGSPPDGLAPMNHQLNDLMVVYAAQPGRVALDGAGENSPFMSVAADVLQAAPEVVFQDALTDITAGVRQLTQDQQSPYIEGTLSFRITLSPAQPTAVAAGPQCAGAPSALALKAHPNGFMELDGKTPHLDFGGAATLCADDQVIRVSGDFDQSFDCNDILASDYNGAEYAFSSAGGVPHAIWMYINPEKAQKTLELGVYREGEQLYWVDTRLPICSP